MRVARRRRDRVLADFVLLHRTIATCDFSCAAGVALVMTVSVVRPIGVGRINESCGTQAQLGRD